MPLPWRWLWNGDCCRLWVFAGWEREKGLLRGLRVRWLWLTFTCNHSQKVPKLCCVGGGFIFKTASTILAQGFTHIGFKQLPSQTVSLTAHLGFVELCSDCTSISKLGKRTNTYRRRMIMIQKLEDNRTWTESVHATSCQWWTVDINQGVYIIAFAFSGSAVPRLRSPKARSIFFIFFFHLASDFFVFSRSLTAESYFISSTRQVLNEQQGSTGAFSQQNFLACFVIDRCCIGVSLPREND